MDISDVRDHLEQECDFPVDQETLVEQLGDIDLEPTTTSPETIATVLDRTETNSYQTADDVYTALIGNVDDGYIGRKHYDDRGGARLTPREQNESL